MKPTIKLERGEAGWKGQVESKHWVIHLAEHENYADAYAEAEKASAELVRRDREEDNTRWRK